jgi:hypothetical protein
MVACYHHLLHCNNTAEEGRGEVGRRGKFWDGGKLVVIALFVAKNKRRKKKAMACLCHHLLRFKMKQEDDGVFFFSSRRKEKKTKTGKKMQRREGSYLSFLTFAFGMKYSSFLFLFTFLQR